MDAGLHSMYLMLNNATSLSSRAYLFSTKVTAHSISLAYGLHSQLLPMSTYFYVKTDTIAGKITESRPNQNLAFPRSHHLILSYNYITPSLWKFSGEVYAQFLRKVLVEPQAGSSYWMLNNSDGFPEFTTVAKGKGTNYGMDLSVERFFSKKYYLLITGSLFSSKYQTADGKIYNSAFNDQFSTAMTLGREFTFKNNSVFQVGARLMYNGGYRYTPADLAASAAQGRFVPLKGADYESQAPAYFRVDGRVSYRSNRKKYATVLSLDVQNATNYINVTSISYNPVTNALEPRKTGNGFVPVLSYQIDF
ncbi:MAG: hypothetical protein R2822_13200 [Spirosomataceae bacterium]